MDLNERTEAAAQPAPTTQPAIAPGGLDEYEGAFGEKSEETLDLNTWAAGEDLQAVYAYLTEQQVRQAVEEEERYREPIRRELFPKLHRIPHAAPDAGLHQFTPELIERAHRGFLFNGAVEAADGTMAIHDTLPITITQIGVYLVSYNGTSGSFAHRLFRKDLRAKGGDLMEEMIDLLERRRRRGSTDHDSQKDSLSSNLFARSLMAWAERAFLLEKSGARWRMGHGNPTPYELLSGAWADRPEMLRVAHDLMRQLVEHRRFVYVTSAPSDRLSLTLGHALGPMEYLVLDTNEDFFKSLLDTGGYRGDKKKAVEALTEEIGPQIVRGLYRVSAEAPPYLFYAHRDLVHEAALIAMADGALQLHRGFPMLIDLADRLCTATFGADDFLATARLAYSQTGPSHRYLGERETRK